MDCYFENYLHFDFDKEAMTGLNSELKCIYALQYSKKYNKTVFLVVNSLYEANYLYQTCNLYSDHVLLFPMDDFLTSEALAISPELKMTRLETMKALLTDSHYIVITNLMGYLRFLPPKETYQKKQVVVRKGDRVDTNELVQRLYEIGYEKDVIVNKTGEMAVRGYIVDVFPNSAENPVRIEFWGDEIDSLRYFDIDSQLMIEEIESVTILPNSEFLKEEKIEGEYRQRDLAHYGEVVNITEYRSDGCVIFDDYHQLEASYRLLVEEMHQYSISVNDKEDTVYMHDFYRPTKLMKKYFLSFDNALKENTIHYATQEVLPFGKTVAQINQRLNDYRKQGTVVVCLKSRYQVNKVLEELENPYFVFTGLDHLFPDKINFVVKNIHDGFIFENMIVIGEKELFHKKSTGDVYKTKFKFGTKIRDITKLNCGDYIVHAIHGIGQYAGIRTLTKNGLKKDYLMILYRGNDKVYIPVEKIDYISKYSSSDGIAPRLNKLGGTEWAKTKLRVKKQVENIAQDLLKLYAEREKMEGFAFEADSEDQLEFEKQFAYQETSDQLRVAEEIKRDMESPHPMDRLLCGDVGYGKTEVAFRAMFKAVMSGKQVALLCPTTILSQQHYQNAIQRFRSFAVNIALLNRFISSREVHRIIQDLKEGKIDILIGTHRLLSDDIVFKDLGLLVIDEEQRFGVKHKEKIKTYKNTVDVLTLSATPIPRTLQLSMAGIRSLSLIETPPVNRYPVQTYVLAENPEIIRDAIYKELSRNGQVFILYNRIEDMNVKKSEIEKLIPQAKTVCAHGKMNKNELEEIMMKFTNQEYDILLCTTIIETGIDIPTANTLIIMDADHFGLSQLYQIRGRVGRSDKIAYCYLMYDSHKILNEIATKRLKVIKDFTELGSGFAIAMRDLSIRGAGNILGSEQSGFVDSVGVELFLEMLSEEVARAKGEIVPEKEAEDLQPLLEVETAIEDSYVSDEALKIEIHKKINEIDSQEKLLAIKEELEDRFGPLPQTLEIYMYEEWFEKLAAMLDIDHIQQTRNFIEITLPPHLSEKIDGEKLFMSLCNLSRMLRFSFKNKRLVIILDTIKLERHFVYYCIDILLEIEKALKKETA